jgi:hypothetical protein
MSMGILTCGAGYRPRQQGYLAFTGPTKIRLEVPRDPIDEFTLPPLNLGKKVPLADIPPMEMQTIKTNKIPPIQTESRAVSSQPPAQPPAPNVVIPPPPAYSFEEMMNRRIPYGFEELLDQSNSFQEEKTTTREVMNMWLTDEQMPKQPPQAPTLQPAPDSDTQTITNAPPNSTQPTP